MDLDGSGDPFGENIYRGDLNKVDDSNPDGERYAFGRKLYQGKNSIREKTKVSHLQPHVSNPRQAKILDYRVAR